MAFYESAGSQLEADQTFKNSQFFLVTQLLKLQLGRGQSSTPIHMLLVNTISFSSADDRVGKRPQTALMSYILSGLVEKVVTLRKGKWIGPIMVQFGDACRRVATGDLA